MLQPEQAKSKFRNLLLWLALALLWPMLALVIATVFGVAGFKSMGILLIALGLIWLAIFVWLVVFLWRLSPHVQVTPWASLWVLFPWLGVFLVGMLYLEPLKYIRDDKPADKRLPSTWGLIKDSFRFFYKTLGDSSKTTIWYFYISLAIGVSAGLTTLWAPYVVLHFIFALALTVMTAWVSVKLLLELAARESGGEPKGDEGETSKKSLAAYFAMALQVMLITIGPMLAAFMVSFVLMAVAGFGMAAAKGDSSSTAGLLSLMAQSALPLIFVGFVFVVLFLASIIWAFYKSNQYAFVLPVLMLEGRLQESAGTVKKGLFKISSESLNESVRLVKGRWWGVFWKNQLFGMTVGITLGLAMEIIMLALVGLLGLAISNKTALGLSATVITGAVQGAGQMLIMPLVLIFQIKLYRAFKRTAQ